MRRIPWLKKLLNERRIRRLTERFFEETAPYRDRDMETLPPEEQAMFRALLVDYLETLDRKRLLYHKPFLAYFLEEGYLDTAEAFTKRARDEDSGLEKEDVFQALRNVWIMNCLQTSWGLKVGVTDSVYAYSMLYPYTDNYLDDPDVSSEAKHGFNERLSAGIQGESPEVLHPSERRVHELLQLIFGEFPPERFPGVQAGLSLIQEGQIRSLSQDASLGHSRGEVLKLSFFKGGASVLADGFLVAGTLALDQQQFAYHYGCFLQLVDDLQDMEEDRAAGQHTVFTLLPPGSPCDEEVAALLAYVAEANRPAAGDSPQLLRMKAIIAYFSRMMVLEVIGRNPKLVSEAYYRELERGSHVRLSFYPRFAERIQSFMGDQAFFSRGAEKTGRV